jgi:hypothetical protein
MSGLSANVKRGEPREIVFWLLLLGSWQFLASPGSKNGVIGAVGTRRSCCSPGPTWID